MYKYLLSFKRPVRWSIGTAPLLIFLFLTGIPQVVSNPQTEMDTQNPDTSPVDVPEIEFSTLVHDFGTMNEGEEATHIFSFRNTGTDTLHIENVKAG
jgi:hypothetical protein